MVECFLFYYYLSVGSFGGGAGEYAYFGAASLFAYPFLKCITVLFTLSTHVMFRFAYHNKHSVWRDVLGKT